MIPRDPHGPDTQPLLKGAEGDENTTFWSSEHRVHNGSFINTLLSQQRLRGKRSVALVPLLQTCRQM